MMRVEVDLTKCIGSGRCAARVPAVFDQGDDDGLAVVLRSNPPAEFHDLVRDAARNCPSGAIAVSDE